MKRRRLGVAIAAAWIAGACVGDSGSGESDGTDGEAGSSSSAGSSSGSSSSSGSGESEAGSTSEGGATGSSAGEAGSASGGSAESGTGSSASEGGSDDTGGGTDVEGCEPLPAPSGTVIMVEPDQAGELPDLVANATAGTTIVLADGIYAVGTVLHFTTDGVTLRSASGDPEAVVLDGDYAAGEIALVEASDVVIAEITLQRAMWHPIHVTGAADRDTTGVRVYRVRVVDPGQQAIKINVSPAGHYVDQGEVACSEIVMTDVGRPHVTDCYTGGIDAHAARGWVVRDNHIEGFWCEQGLSEHGIHFWIGSRDTRIERNLIVDCARGIGLGLGEMGNGMSRPWADDPCPGASYLGHVDGFVANNRILGARPELFASASGQDSGIALEQACGTEVVHNTVVSLETPFVSVEYRFANTDVHLANNLVTHTIMERDDGAATLEGNIENAETDMFVSAAAGDLHLRTDAWVMNLGVDLGDRLPYDFEGDARVCLAEPGADEVPAVPCE